MKIEKPKSLILPVAVATIFSLLGWLGLPGRPPIYLDALPGFKIFLALLAMPGTLVAVALAMVFSPQGGHGADQFAWIIPPANWFIYFGLAILLRSLRRQKSG
jgi:hypothetical protein